MAPVSYPSFPAGTHTDRYHGREVADPYRALEDTDAPRTRAWIEEQNALTADVIRATGRREAVHDRLARLWNYARAGLPVCRGGRCLRTRNTGLQNQDVLYASESPREEGRVLLDPNELSRDGTVSLSSFAASYDGRYLAYGLNDGGSDWITFRVRSIDDGRDLDDEARWSKFCEPVWLPDSSGFIYLSYEAPRKALADSNTAPHLRLHRIGTSQDDDESLFSMPDHPDRLFSPAISDDREMIVISVMQGSADRNHVYLRSIAGGEVTPLVTAFEAEFEFIGNDGNRYYFLTDAQAESGRIVAIDVTSRVPQHGIPELEEIVAPCSDTLIHARIFGDDLVLLYLHHAQSRLRRRPLAAPPATEIPLPGIGTVSGISGERWDPEVYYQYTSFLEPEVNLAYDLETGSSTTLDAASLDFDPAPYVTEQLFATSRDGTAVPLFVVRRRDVELDGSHPALLWGYGGFNIPIRPFFTVSRAVWLELGGVLAVACLRGGGEYGTKWHEAGTKLRKQNVFDDFIACAETLIAGGYTSASHLAIQGGSNGGLLVGACITQRPELFAAAHAAVGVFDMLRYQEFTIGWAWAGDFGTSGDEDEFKALYAYSPLHNVTDGTCCPATLLTTGDHDDRVVPGHSFKFAARLQHAQGCANPVLLRVETRTGHGAGKPTSLLIEEQADVLSFLLGHTDRTRG